MKAKKVKVIDVNGLDEITISKIEEVMLYTKDYYENETLFVELHNSKEEVIRIFPERIQIL
jgi:tetrahydromethanopterin S-methyltransferase subunit A